MLEQSQLPDGRTLLAMNYSSLELIQTCLRKAQHSLLHGLRGETPATAFGYAVHKALEHWYTLAVADRGILPKFRETAEQMAYGHGLEQPYEGALESVRQFVLAGQEALRPLGDVDKRSLANGIKILQAYFKHYAEDRWIVASDASGPMVERQIEFELYADRDLVIRYHGQIDVVLQNMDTGVMLPADHKTTASLGSEFYQRCKPNPQYTGYALGARECLGVNSQLFMVNGIQVAKTKHDFARQITSRGEEDYAELRASVVEQSKRWLAAKASNTFTQSAPNPCTMYGGCQFLCLCEVPAKLRLNVMRSKWPEAQVA